MTRLLFAGILGYCGPAARQEQLALAQAAATASTRKRLIGPDATLYGRTFAHDGFEASWNLLNGDLITRELRLSKGGTEDAYDPIAEHKSKRRVPPVWLSESPDPEELLAELGGD